MSRITTPTSPPADIVRSARHGFRTLLAASLVAPALIAAASQRQLGAPVYDTEAETTYRQVHWRDFKGGGQAPPGWNRWSRGSYAHIATGLRPGVYEIELRQDGGAWTAFAVDVRPYAVMDKYHSAVKPGSRKADVLAHEQLHFDVAETVARRLAVEMRALVGHGASEKEARRELEEKLRQRFERGLEELSELQAAYDRETANGQNRKRQAKWTARIETEFRRATEALAAELDPAGR